LLLCWSVPINYVSVGDDGCRETSCVLTFAFTLFC
jgi:hypothetical protein